MQVRAYYFRPTDHCTREYHHDQWPTCGRTIGNPINKYFGTFRLNEIVWYIYGGYGTKESQNASVSDAPKLVDPDYHGRPVIVQNLNLDHDSTQSGIHAYV